MYLKILILLPNAANNSYPLDKKKIFLNSNVGYSEAQYNILPYYSIHS